MLLQNTPSKLTVTTGSFNKTRYRFIAAFAFSFCIFNASAQDDHSAQTIEELLGQRAYRIEHYQSTKDLDRSLLSLGYHPKAIMRTTLLENGQVKMEFPYFTEMTPGSPENYAERLTGYYTFLISLVVNTASETVVCILQKGTTESQMEELSNHFGYTGHEVRN